MKLITGLLSTAMLLVTTPTMVLAELSLSASSPPCTYSIPEISISVPGKNFSIELENSTTTTCYANAINPRVYANVPAKSRKDFEQAMIAGINNGNRGSYLIALDFFAYACKLSEYKSLEAKRGWFAAYTAHLMEYGSQKEYAPYKWREISGEPKSELTEDGKSILRGFGIEGN